jgi:hypothetical protein
VFIVLLKLIGVVIVMSILERLLEEVPKRKPSSVLNPQRQLVREYMADIAEAKERGYSWWQINRAVKKDAEERGVWNEEWGRWSLESLYNQIRKDEAGV